MISTWIAGRTTREKLALIILLNLILSIPSLWVPYYKVDELTNALFARFINRGTLGLKDFLGNTYFFTHYLYALVLKFTSGNTLIPMHAVNAIWKSLTIIALYRAGKYFIDEKTGLWSALFYCVSSYCFLSKDFHTPSAESFSLLPAALSAGFVLKGVDDDRMRSFFWAGVFVAVATLFKAPMGITILAINTMLLVRGRHFFRHGVVTSMGFILAFFIPAYLYFPPYEGVTRVLDTMLGVQTYIQFHSDPTLYWASKFIIRILLVACASAGMSLFVLHGLRNLFLLRSVDRAMWTKLFFLVTWLICLGFTVTLGKRIFFYYFIFLLAPLSLIAGGSLVQFDRRLCASSGREQTWFFRFMGGVRRYIFIILAVPLIGFSIEGALNYSTLAVMPSNFHDIIRYVQTHTQEEDRIFVWGYIPQIYFYSGRLPSGVHFWSDALAGSSPGSPAMEYLHATGKTLSLNEKLAKDFTANPFQQKSESEMEVHAGLAGVGEVELFNYQELLNQIANPYWKEVFADFFAHPPQLFIDSSPLNYRGFGYYPINKYELLKRFIADNYELETTVDHMIIYRLKKAS